MIESDAGYSIEWRGMDVLIYREGPKTLHVDAELLAPGASRFLVIYTRSPMKWQPPHAGTTIDDQLKQTILDNITAALRSIGREIAIL